MDADVPGDDLHVKRGVVIPAAELHESTSRAGGAGGQHVNKTSSRVTLRWNVTTTEALGDEQRARVLKALATRLTLAGELVVHVDDDRSQYRNRQLARERLADVLRGALVVPKVRRATKPTRGSKKRRLSQKKRRGDVKKGRRPPRLDD